MHRCIGGDGGGRKCGKRKHILIKHDVTRDIDSVRRNMEAFVPFVESTVPEKDTLLRPKLEFVFVVWSKVRPTCTPEDLQKSVIGSFIKQEF
jgi:hypothetical protein